MSDGLNDIPLFINPGPIDPRTRLKKEFANSGALMNARGEILLLPYQKHQRPVPLLLPDGSLQATTSPPHPGQSILALVDHSGLTGREGRFSWEPAVVPLPDWDRRRARQLLLRQPLGPNRYSYGGWGRHVQVVARRGHRRPYRYRFFRLVPNHGAYALAGSTAHRLTKFRYTIRPFHENRALAELQAARPVGHGKQRQWQRFVFLDWQGREVVQVPAGVGEVTDFEGGTALMWKWEIIESNNPTHLRRGGILDTLGRVLLPLNSILSPPDGCGLLRCREAAGADSITRFLTRQGQPAFAGNPRFRQAEPFYNGRAWAEALDGRQGLLNRRGEWVTPLAYELLGSAPMRSAARQHYWHLAYRHDNPLTEEAKKWFNRGGYATENDLPADTAYMLARRTGHYGWVARHTGREVIPARYDSVIFHLTGGVACAVREGRRYVVTARGRELVQATYQGDWYDYPGQPLHLFRPADGRWTVIDTSGRARLPWLPGTGLLTPDGRAVVREPEIAGQERLPGGLYESQCSGVVEASGRVVIPFSSGVGYSGSFTGLHFESMKAVSYPPFHLKSNETSQQPSQAYRVEGLYPPGLEYSYLLLAAADLRPFTPSTFYNLKLLANGWHVGLRTADSLAVLISPAGRQLVAPKGTRWERYYDYQAADNQAPPFTHGIEKVRYGELGGPYNSAPTATAT